jgi:protocatechuate 3,4-dioxygenase beta subunit
MLEAFAGAPLADSLAFFHFVAPLVQRVRFPIEMNTNLSRRLFLGTAITGLGAAACGRPREYVAGTTASPVATPMGTQPVATTAPVTTATARESCTLTEDNIEGPFFKAGAPNRAALVDAKAKGTKLTLSGRVLSRKCEPIPGALVEVWQADHEGAYDNEGYGFRAKMQCDEEGVFVLQSIIPGRYLNGERYRPAHLHLKLAAPGARPLTTQLYFEGDPYNVGDPFIKKSLIMTLSDTPWGKAASHDIVLG